jgi:hypothetical protein
VVGSAQARARLAAHGARPAAAAAARGGGAPRRPARAALTLRRQPEDGYGPALEARRQRPLGVVLRQQPRHREVAPLDPEPRGVVHAVVHLQPAVGGADHNVGVARRRHGARPGLELAVEELVEGGVLVQRLLRLLHRDLPAEAVHKGADERGALRRVARAALLGAHAHQLLGQALPHGGAAHLRLVHVAHGEGEHGGEGLLHHHLAAPVEHQDVRRLRAQPQAARAVALPPGGRHGEGLAAQRVRRPLAQLHHPRPRRLRLRPEPGAQLPRGGAAAGGRGARRRQGERHVEEVGGVVLRVGRQFRPVHGAPPYQASEPAALGQRRRELAGVDAAAGVGVGGLEQFAQLLGGQARAEGAQQGAQLLLRQHPIAGEVGQSQQILPDLALEVAQRGGVPRQPQVAPHRRRVRGVAQLKLARDHGPALGRGSASVGGGAGVDGRDDKVRGQVDLAPGLQVVSQRGLLEERHPHDGGAPPLHHEVAPLVKRQRRAGRFGLDAGRGPGLLADAHGAEVRLPLLRVQEHRLLHVEPDQACSRKHAAQCSVSDGRCRRRVGAALTAAQVQGLPAARDTAHHACGMP